MKKAITVSTSGSGNGARRAIRWILSAVLLLLLPAAALHGVSLQRHQINEIFIRSTPKAAKSGQLKRTGKLKKLLAFKPGDYFSYKENRKSIENLYKTGLFTDIESRVKILPDEKIDIYFETVPRFKVRAVHIRKSIKYKRSKMMAAIFSLRKDAWFEPSSVAAAEQEIRAFLNSRGYFNPEITHTIQKDDRRSRVDVRFKIKTGKITAVEKINFTFTIPNREMFDMVKDYFIHTTRYIPFRFQGILERVRNRLKKEKYYFPELSVDEHFQDETKSTVNLHVTIKPGYRYVFKFAGVKSKIDLIASTWEKKVFEAWAEKESKARILYHLTNKGYLDAEVDSRIDIKNFAKHITFTVDRRQQYRLGKIRFAGNTAFTDRELLKLIKTDDLFFDKYIHLRSRSLRIDREVLRLHYYFKGFPSAEISMLPSFRGRKADIDFIIEEGKKYTVDTILFSGSRVFDSETLSTLFETRGNGPFVQQKLNEDVERLKNYYLSRGFDAIEVTPEISAGTEKSILVHVKEGPVYRVGNLVVIGASGPQESLVRKLFPLKTDAPYNQLEVDKFRRTIEGSSIFTEFVVLKLPRADNVIDVLIKTTPDKTKYYGFGAGWVQDKGPRISLEYQERNIFDRYSSLSTIFQVGKKELRGIISYDTPFFFRRKLNSEFKIWGDNEIYSTYKFFRYGLSESLIKRITGNSYVMASLSWYRTTLEELEITSHGVDKEDVPFDTTAFHLSYERENRDDPFNPSKGSFFSSDIKVGIPLFEKNYSFVKFRWRYQQNFKFLKNGIISFSVRNGLASGDMSITERFFAGGPNSFRGARIDQLGPLDPVVDDITLEVSEKPRGGNALLLLNLEATFPFPIPVVPGYDLYYSIFADIGNVFDKAPDINLKELRKAVGVSLKLKTPLGPLWGSLAWNLDRKTWIISGGIGNVF